MLFRPTLRPSIPSLPRQNFARLAQFVAANIIQAHVHSHGVLIGPMLGGHAAPALGSSASSGGAGPRPQAGASLGVAHSASCNATSVGPAGFLAYVGAEGHDFFYRRIVPAMRRGCGQSVPKPCSCPGLGPT